MGIGIAIVGLLWLAPDSRRFFGDPPLNVTPPTR
jgi:hypothetical protein